MWIKLNTTQATEKIEVYRSDKKSTNKNTKKLRGKPFNVEEKTTKQIWSIHYNKIEITTLKLYSKPEFTINWEKYNNTPRNKYNLTTKLVARSFTLNISILCDCSTQIIVLEKTPIYLHCVSRAKEKSHFLFSLSATQNTILFLSIDFKFVFHSSVSLNLSHYSWNPHAQALYKSFAARHS